MANSIDILVALQTSQAINAFNSMMGHFQTSPMSRIGGALTAGVSAPMIAGLAVATGEAVKFNSAMSNAQRTLDLTAGETRALSAEILTMAPSLGLIPEEFAKVAAEAGKLGVAKNELADFGKTIAQLSAISDVPIDEFVKKAGTIKTVFNQNTKEFETFGAAVNSLDDRIGGTTPNILEFTARVGAVGKNMGLTATEVAAFGAVFETVGIAPERAGTAFQNFANQLFTINAASPKAKAAFESMGFSATEFSQTMARDPKAAILTFLDSLNGIKDPVEKSTLLVEIFGKSSSSEIASLAGQTDKLKAAFKLAGDETGNLAKMQSEFAIKMQDPAMQAKVLQAQFSALGVQFGSVLIPLLSQAIGVITPLATAFSQFLTLNPEWAKFFVVAAGGLAIIGPLVSVVGTLITVFSGAVGAVTSTIAVVTSLGGILSTLGLVFGTIGSAIATFGAALFTIPVAIAAVVAGLTALAFNVGGSRDALNGLAVSILDTLIGAFDSGVSAVISFSSSAASAIANFISSAVDTVSSGMSSFVSAISSGLSSAINGFNQFGSSIISAVQSAVQSAVSSVQSAAGSFFSAGASLMSSFANGVLSNVSSAYNAVSGAVSDIRNLLPFSPAKEGPLSDLDKSGQSFFSVFADSLNGDTLRNRISGILDSIDLSAPNMSLATTGAASGGSDAGASGPINYTQNITISTNTSPAEIIAALKGAQREFLNFIDSASASVRRKQT